MNIDDKLEEFRKKYQQIAIKNHEKVLLAFKNAQVSTEAFNGSTGYGYSDFGRVKLNQLYSYIFKGEDSLVSGNFASGTHAIYTAIKSFVAPGDTVVSLTGVLYDTIDKAIKEEEGLINKYAINFQQWEMVDNKININKIIAGSLEKAKIAIIQRSRGYSIRKSITIEEIKVIAQLIKKYAPNTILFVDNCYGEFVEDREPLEVGADVIAGSLIKNPGGSIAVSGGYVVGKKELIKKVADGFTVPGIGREIGCESSESLRLMFQGIFLAPKIVEESLLSACYLALVMEDLGFKVNPKYNEYKTDIIQSIYFENKDNLVEFIQALQYYSPVDSFIKPLPWDMPGYKHQVIMASGSFISGSSLELSADAPIRKPYIAYYQGGVSWYYSKLAIDNYSSIFLGKNKGYINLFR